MNFSRLSALLAALLALVTGIALAAPASSAPAASPAVPALPAPVLSSTAQRLFSAAQNDLLQIRVLLKTGRTQASVGSGFMIGTSNLVVTNYHVVSQFALEPETYAGEYVDTRGQRGAVELLAVDVLHDLAVIRIDRNGTGFFKVPEQLPELTQGQYLYSLGNPLDLGFAISEGAYNGIVTRSFYDQFMFTGPINAGMSGGPNITDSGRVAGVNVAKRQDGELVSFLVPARYVRDLLTLAANQPAPPKDFKQIVGQQLLAHQSVMVDRLLAKPFSLRSLGPYRVPVRESDQVRCWGSSDTKPETPFSVEQMRCAMESNIFVSSQMQTGHVAIRHEFSRSTELGALRFSDLASRSFKNESFGSHKDQRLTRPICTEQFVAGQNLPLRAVLCVRAYRKFAGLYHFGLLTASTDESQMSLQSRLDAYGVSYDNGLRLARVFLESISRERKP